MYQTWPRKYCRLSLVLGASEGRKPATMSQTGLSRVSINWLKPFPEHEAQPVGKPVRPDPNQTPIAHSNFADASHTRP